MPCTEKAPWRWLHARPTSTAGGDTVPRSTCLLHSPVPRKSKTKGRYRFSVERQPVEPAPSACSTRSSYTGHTICTTLPFEGIPPFCLALSSLHRLRQGD